MSQRPTFAEQFVAELQAEGEITRRFIARIPNDHLGWRAHDKSHTIGELAYHLAVLPQAIPAASLMEPFAADEAGSFWEQPSSVDEVLATLDASLAAGEEQLGSMSDDDYLSIWNATVGGNVVMTIPRDVMLRNILFNHTCHHRGQLGVYLRLIGEKVPSSYGPSGDEMPSFLADMAEMA